SPYSGQLTKVMAALWMPIKPLPSSWMNERKSAFCCASISRSPPVKKSTASKLLRFLALYSSFFLVRASASVRRVVSHRPVSRPSRSIVDMACDTDSCRYPFSSPITRRCFFCWRADWARQSVLSRADVKRVRRMIFMFSCSRQNSVARDRGLIVRGWFLFRLQVLGRHVGVIDQVEKANHHLVPALLAPDYSFCGVRILRIVR